MSMGNLFHSALTLEDVAESRELERKRREWGLIERLAKGSTTPGFDMYAECVSCGARVSHWRSHVHEVADYDDKRPEGASALLAYPKACSACGGSVVAVRAEPRVSFSGAP
jgi:hypothetical protein